VSADQVAAFRLARHRLAARATPSELPAIAGSMSGVQAQVMSAARVSLWARSRGLRIGDVEAALWRDRSLAKAWCMRGTSYLVPSEDFDVFVRGCSRRANRSLEWLVRAGVSLAAIDRVTEAVGNVLDRPLTRREVVPLVAEALRARTRSWSPQRGGWGSRAAVTGLEVDGHSLSIGGILYVASIRGVACVGPPRGSESTYVRRDVWLPAVPRLPADVAEPELLRRYLRAFGPATVADFAWWTYLKAADAREVWGRLEGELAPVDVEGRPGWVLRSDVHHLERASLDGPVVRLLPSFDSFLLGHKDKSHLVEAARYTRVYRPAGWLAPVLLVDGRVAGVWSMTRKAGRLVVRVEAFTRLSAALRAAVQDETEDLGRFLGMPDVRVAFIGGGRGSRPSSRQARRPPRVRGSRGARAPP